MSDKTGGCAFPNGYEYSVNAEGNRVPFSPGMTLRDYFAIRMLVPAMSNVPWRQPTSSWDGSVISNSSPAAKEHFAKYRADLAAELYRLADAMLAERAKP